jgi:hypothetical protein
MYVGDSLFGASILLFIALLPPVTTRLPRDSKGGATLRPRNTQLLCQNKYLYINIHMCTCYSGHDSLFLKSKRAQRQSHPLPRYDVNYPNDFSTSERNRIPFTFKPFITNTTTKMILRVRTNHHGKWQEGLQENACI